MLLLANIVLPIEIDDNEQCHPYMDRMSITFQTIQELPPQNDMQNQVIDYVRTLLSPQKGVSQQGSEKAISGTIPEVSSTESEKRISETIPEVSPIESEKEISENIPEVSSKESQETSLKEQEKEFPIEEKYKKEIFIQQTSLIESEKEISEKKLSSTESEKEKEVLNTTFKHYKKPRKMYTAKNYDNKGR
jgi:hypothetical protein